MMIIVRWWRWRYLVHYVWLMTALALVSAPVLSLIIIYFEPPMLTPYWLADWYNNYDGYRCDYDLWRRLPPWVKGMVSFGQVTCFMVGSGLLLGLLYHIRGNRGKGGKDALAG